MTAPVKSPQLFFSRGRLSSPLPQQFSGYSDGLLLDRDIPEEFRCILCSGVMKESVILACKCLLSVCNACADAWFARQKGRRRHCPQCRAPVRDVQPNRPLRSMIGRLRVRCVHWEQKCGWQGTTSELEDHHLPKDCRKVLEACPNPRCTAYIPRDAREAHLCVCPYATAPCEFCGKAFPRNELGVHLPMCEMHPVDCPGQCGKQGLVRSTVGKHVTEECPKVLVTCPVPMCAMNGKIERGLLSRHMEEAFQMHMEARIAALEEANRELIRQRDEDRAKMAALLERLAPLDELIARESERVAGARAVEIEHSERAENELRARREAEEAVDNNFCWDSNDKDGPLVLSDGNKTISNPTSDVSSVVGAVGFTSGIHRWKLRVDELGWLVAVGVHPKPRPGGPASLKTGYGTISDSAVCYGPPRGSLPDWKGIKMRAGDVVSVELNCGTHTLTLTNPGSGNGRTSFSLPVPPGTSLFPWACLRGGSGSATLTLMPF